MEYRDLYIMVIIGGVFLVLGILGFYMGQKRRTVMVRDCVFEN